MKKYFLAVLMCCFWLVPVYSDSVIDGNLQKNMDRSNYVFGVFPFIPDSRLEGIFAPLARELSLALGQKVLYRSASTFEKFMTRLENKDFDIALIQPFDYVRIAAPAGYYPVARRWQDLRAVFVVLGDSDLKSLKDLTGKKVSLPPEVSAVSYLGQAALLQEGLVVLKDVHLDFTKGHHAALQDVVIKKSAAAVTSVPSLALFQNDLDIELKILAKSIAIPQILFVVHERVSANAHQVIKQALLDTNVAEVTEKNKSGRVKGNRKPFIEATESDYEIVHRMWQDLRKAQ